MNNMNDMQKIIKIARLVLDLKDEGVSTDTLISALAGAISMLIDVDNLDFKKTWKIVYIASLILHE